MKVGEATTDRLLERPGSVHASLIGQVLIDSFPQAPPGGALLSGKLPYRRGGSDTGQEVIPSQQLQELLDLSGFSVRSFIRELYEAVDPGPRRR